MIILWQSLCEVIPLTIKTINNVRCLICDKVIYKHIDAGLIRGWQGPASGKPSARMLIDDQNKKYGLIAVIPWLVLPPVGTCCQTFNLSTIHIDGRRWYLRKLKSNSCLPGGVDNYSNTHQFLKRRGTLSGSNRLSWRAKIYIFTATSLVDIIRRNSHARTRS